MDDGRCIMSAVIRKRPVSNHSHHKPSDMSQNPYYNPYTQQSHSHESNSHRQPYGPWNPGSSSNAPIPANAYEYDVGILAQQSVYVPGAMIDKKGGAGGKLAKGGKRVTVLRKGGGKVWEDQTLLEWDSSKSELQVNSVFTFIVCIEWFRLFVGDLSNDVSDDVLANAFNKYPSFTKARVIRDRLSQKVSSPFHNDNIWLICIAG